MKTVIKLLFTYIFILFVFSCDNKPQADTKPKQFAKVETDSTTLLMFQKKEIVAKMLYKNPTPEQVESVDFEATIADLNKGIEFFEKEIAQTDGLMKMNGCGNWYGQVLASDKKAKKIRNGLSNLTVIVEELRDEYYYLQYDRYCDRFPKDANWIEH